MNQPKRRRRITQVVVACLAALTMVLFPGITAPTPAQAAPVVGFNAGNIISDGLFYDGNAMTATEVQNFLNRRVPHCTIGTVDYKQPGSTLATINPVASHCLKDLRITTQSKSANANCAAYVGAANETAAQIIAKVGKACGISQKALLVLLEKEQSLVSDSWPTVRMFNYAMGWGCPDSGPGNTANCDSSGAGFAYQVYQSAWQFKQYKTNPTSPSWVRYHPFRTASIQWHPNASCGTSNVYLENWATSALYIYTPYRPNQAALNAGWGTGDACSSYGNRNFYNLYKSWFGSPTLVLDERFKALFNSLNSSLGEITGNAISVAGGVKQELERGTMYWHPNSGSAFVAGGIRQTLESAGGVEVLGFPLGSEQRESWGWQQKFQRSTLLWSTSRGGQVVAGGINAFFTANGGISTFGLPLAKERSWQSGWAQDFDRGMLTWSSSSGGGAVTGALKTSYLERGGPAKLGFPIGAQKQISDAWLQRFEGGDLFWHEATKDVFVTGGIRTYYLATGGYERWGLPTSDESKQAQGHWVQEFEQGLATWSSVGGSAILTNYLRDHFLLHGASFAGHPMGVPTQVGGGAFNQFTLGDVYASDTTPIVLVAGGIRTQLMKSGGADAIGLPLSAQVKRPDGSWEQGFENGIVTWSAAGGGAVLQASTKEYLEVRGSAAIGFPIGSDRPISGGFAQEFTRGTVYWKQDGSHYLVTGGIRNAFLNSGGVETIGFPQSEERALEGGQWAQTFDHAEVTWSPNGVSIVMNAN